MIKALLVTGAGAQIGADIPTLTTETIARVQAAIAVYTPGACIVIMSEGAATCGRRAAEMMADFFKEQPGNENVEVLVDAEAADTCQNVEFAARLLRERKSLEATDVELTIVCEPKEQFKRALVTAKAFGFKDVKNLPVEVPGGFTLKRRVMGWIFMLITLADPTGKDPANLLVQHNRRSRKAMWDRELNA